ncbi:MAG: SCP2 sterol-binding domain-containing protein [Candidatus Hodarchaeota archaeon]
MSGNREVVDGIISGEINAINAVMSKGLKIKGAMADIMDLKKLLSMRD